MQKRSFSPVAFLVLFWTNALPFSTGVCAPFSVPDTSPKVILFVGNSFCHGKYSPVRNYNAAAVTDENYNLPRTDPRSTHFAGETGPYGGVPGIFKKLTDRAGLHYEVHVEAISATTLEFHYKHALALIAQAKWSAVVLQEYSTLPLPPTRGGKPENFLAHATLLEKSVHAVNPAARLYLYETWPRADLTYPDTAAYHGESIDAMGNDLHEGYQRAFTADGHFVGVARVGDAWLNAIHSGTARDNPYQPVAKPGQLDLWGPDYYHPSIYGAYLSALVLFQEITKIEPHTLGAGESAAHDLGISSKDAAQLQAVAEAVARTPSAPEAGIPAVR